MTNSLRDHSPLRVVGGFVGTGVLAIGVATGLGAGLLSVAGRAYIIARSRHLVVTDQRSIGPAPEAPPESGLGATARPAVVLGAGLRPDGTPTGLLARRVEAAVGLFERGVVSHLVMSGDANSGGNQPEAMRRLAVELGVPNEHISLDLSGVDTAATCRRVRRDYPGTPVVLVTQAFHAHRTAYLAQKADLDAVVFASADAEVRVKALIKARIREVPASVKAIGLDRFL